MIRRRRLFHKIVQLMFRWQIMSSRTVGSAMWINSSCVSATDITSIQVQRCNAVCRPESLSAFPPAEYSNTNHPPAGRQSITRPFRKPPLPPHGTTEQRTSSPARRRWSQYGATKTGAPFLAAFQSQGRCGRKSAICRPTRNGNVKLASIDEAILHLPRTASCIALVETPCP